MYNNGLKPATKVNGEKSVYRWLEKLEEIGCVTIKKTSKYSVISIAGWSEYKRNDYSFDYENYHLNIRRMITKEEVKEIKNNNIVHQ